MSKDKILHQYLSYVIYMICFGLLNKLFPIFLCIIMSTIITIGIGLFKEYIIDLRLRNKLVDKEDIIHDLIGIGLALLTSLIFI